MRVLDFGWIELAAALDRRRLLGQRDKIVVCTFDDNVAEVNDRPRVDIESDRHRDIVNPFGRGQHTNVRVAEPAQSFDQRPLGRDHVVVDENGTVLDGDVLARAANEVLVQPTKRHRADGYRRTKIDFEDNRDPLTLDVAGQPWCHRGPRIALASQKKGGRGERPRPALAGRRVGRCRPSNPLLSAKAKPLRRLFARVRSGIPLILTDSVIQPL